MKGIFDKALKLTIKNQILNYDVSTDTLIYHESIITRSRKNGYSAFDQNERLIGIVFMSDDERTVRYGNAEILFLKKFEHEFGTWRIIKQNGVYLPFEKLETILKTKQSFICLTDSRIR